MQDGRAHALGMVDAVMYPGTQSFMRWEHPCASAAAVARLRARRGAAASWTRWASGTASSTWNSFTTRQGPAHRDRVQSAAGLAVRRPVPPRARRGRARPWRWHSPWAGTLPQLPRQPSRVADAAASFVYRSFDPPETWGDDARAAGNARGWHASSRTPCCSPTRRQRPRAGSAISNGSAATATASCTSVGMTQQDLRHRCEAASAILGWPAPYAGDLPRTTGWRLRAPWRRCPWRGPGPAAALRGARCRRRRPGGGRRLGIAAGLHPRHGTPTMTATTPHAPCHWARPAPPGRGSSPPAARAASRMSACCARCTSWDWRPTWIVGASVGALIGEHCAPRALGAPGDRDPGSGGCSR